MLLLELAGDELVVLANILEGILCHEPLQVAVLFDDVGRCEVVDVGALHAQGYENLATDIEPTPALY